MELIVKMFEEAAHNQLIQLAAVAAVCDTAFGVLRAIKERKFNSCIGIDGAIRKIAMIVSLMFASIIDMLLSINLIGFVPAEIREIFGIEVLGIAGFFALLYIAYEVISTLKNMALCGLPVKKVWLKVKEMLGKYTDELPSE